MVFFFFYNMWRLQLHLVEDGAITFRTQQFTSIGLQLKC